MLIDTLCAMNYQKSHQGLTFSRFDLSGSEISIQLPVATPRRKGKYLLVTVRSDALGIMRYAYLLSDPNDIRDLLGLFPTLLAELAYIGQSASIEMRYSEQLEHVDLLPDL